MITLTEIKGTDGLGASRITINNNFKALEKAVNDFDASVNIGETRIVIGRDGDTNFKIDVLNNMFITGGIKVNGDFECGGKLVVGHTELTEEQLVALIELIPVSPVTAI